MTTIRAKFRVTAVKFFGDPTTNPDASRQYTLNAIHDTSTEENRRFTKATPWANLEMTVDNPKAWLEVGEHYYVDFTPVDEAKALEANTTYTSDAGYLSESPDQATHHPDVETGKGTGDYVNTSNTTDGVTGVYTPGAPELQDNA
jgi:hypothetical protein